MGGGVELAGYAKADGGRFGDEVGAECQVKDQRLAEVAAQFAGGKAGKGGYGGGGAERAVMVLQLGGGAYLVGG